MEKMDGATGGKKRKTNSLQEKILECSRVRVRGRGEGKEEEEKKRTASPCSLSTEKGAKARMKEHEDRNCS